MFSWEHISTSTHGLLFKCVSMDICAFWYHLARKITLLKSYMTRHLHSSLYICNLFHAHTYTYAHIPISVFMCYIPTKTHTSIFTHSREFNTNIYTIHTYAQAPAFKYNHKCMHMQNHTRFYRKIVWAFVFKHTHSTIQSSTNILSHVNHDKKLNLKRPKMWHLNCYIQWHFIDKPSTLLQVLGAPT